VPGSKIGRKQLKIKFKLYVLIITMLLMYFPARSMAGSITGTVKVRGLRSPENILVYLAKAPVVSMDPSDADYVMDQQNLAFLPYLLPIPVGAVVSFPNRDKVDHNVFSLSRTKKFNLGSYKPGENKKVTFDKPGIVELRCDVHAEMVAYIMVMKNPSYAITDKAGKFKITDAPPGKVHIRTWHEKLKNGRHKAVIPDKGEISVNLALTRGTPGVLYK
jgi:plastocyanin